MSRSRAEQQITEQIADEKALDTSDTSPGYKSSRDEVDVESEVEVKSEIKKVWLNALLVSLPEPEYSLQRRKEEKKRRRE